PADSNEPRQAALGAGPPFHAPIVDLEAWVFTLPDRDAGFEAGDGTAFERAVDLQRGAPRAAPRQRYRQPFAATEQVDRAHAAAIREPIAVRVIDDRQEHQAIADSPERPRRALNHAAGRECARLLVHDQQDRHIA